MNRNEAHAGKDIEIEVVITAYDQGEMVREALQSVCAQTRRPARVLIVDDGSTDEQSLCVLEQIRSQQEWEVPVHVLRQENRGVSAARNVGIRMTQAPFVVVLDGDDTIEPAFLEKTCDMLEAQPTMVAASAWLHTFGVMDAVVQSCGGDVRAFLSRNCAPATHMLRRSAWEACGGYDETMRSGFEDWDFFLSMLEVAPDACIGIVEQPLINYRTAPASSNVRSMEKRLELMRYLIGKHEQLYREHVADAVLGVEAVSMSRLYGWEVQILENMQHDRSVTREAAEFMRHPSYGDGGMAAAVRIASAMKK